MKKKYDFDLIIDRTGTHSVKWEGYESLYPGYKIEEAQMLSMWVADMDLPCPREVVEAIQKRAEHEIYGYISSSALDDFKNAAQAWYARQYGYETQLSWMSFSPGIVPAINAVIQEFTAPGDGVIVQQPVYYPFSNSVLNNDRNLQINQLLEVDGRYGMNYEELEEMAAMPETKLFILCNPHNPAGRVWTREELYKVLEICHKNGVLIFSDEIHADMILSGQRFTSTGAISPTFQENLIQGFAPSKTFNIAGLGASILVAASPILKERLDRRMLINQYPTTSTFGLVAGEAAYAYGDDYLAELLEYIEGNIDYAIEFVEEHLEGVQLKKPEGTYLVWMDFRGTGLEPKEIYSRILEKAKIAVDLGDWFGRGGEGFARINFACPRSYVEEAMNRLAKAFPKSES